MSQDKIPNEEFEKLIANPGYADEQPEMVNRRKCPRYFVKGNVSFAVRENDEAPQTQPRQGVIYDIAEEGLSFFASESLQPGTELAVRFAIDGFDNMVEVAASVIWSSGDEDNRVGIQFIGTERIV